MAMYQRTQIQVKADPLKNGEVAYHDEEVVQTLWNKVRSTFNTDMRAITFSQLSQADKYKWSSALLCYINEKDEIKVVLNEKMLTPRGNIQIAREVTLAANVQKALSLRGAVIMANCVQEQKMLHISQVSYQKLGDYVRKMRPAQMQLQTSSSNAFAMAVILGALMAAEDEK